MLQRETFVSAGTLVRRDALDEIAPLVPLPHAVIITGLRRAGKSTLLRQIKEWYYPDKDFYYCNFDDERFLSFTVQDFELLHESLVELFGTASVFFFDEIQNIPGWEAFVRRMIDVGSKFFITGSNASMLSKELGTRLTGRHVNKVLYPFSFKEYLTFHHVEVPAIMRAESRASIKREFTAYLERGGLPEYLRYGEDIIVKMLYENILYRDVMARYNLTDEKSVKELAFYLVSNPGTEISFNKLRAMLALGSVTTIKKYIEFIENAYMIRTVYKHDTSVKRQIYSGKKVYVVDTALVTFLAFKIARFTGKVLENAVFMELARRGKQVFFFKDAGECDFLVVDRNVVVDAIQVTTTLDGTKPREYKGLLEAMKVHKLGAGTIITMEEESEDRVDGKTIHVRPAWKWFLGLA